MSLVHLAAKAGQTNAIRYLLENRRLDVNVKVLIRALVFAGKWNVHYISVFDAI